jgi:DNA-binding IclR family transcriptional regulator
MEKQSKSRAVSMPVNGFNARPPARNSPARKAAPETPVVQSLDRGLMILEAVAKANGPVPLGELRTLLGINRSSVFRLANTLRRRGFLANPKGRNDYIAGPSSWRLFRNYDWSLLVSFCRPYLKVLANKTGETAHLAVRQGKQALFVDHQASRNRIIAVSEQTGEFKPLYCTAHGKALLADHDAAGLRAILGPEPFHAHTPQTIVSIEKLARQCAGIKIRDFVPDEAEFEEEVRCVAAPIRDKEGVIVASIGISAPLARLSPEKLDEAARQTCETAREITHLLCAQM